MQGYPPAIIHKKERLSYITALETAQLGGPILPFYQFIEKSVDESLELYLKATQGKTPSIKQEEHLLKIGELSKKTSTPIPTLRFWIQKGLLKPSDKTFGGFLLFSSSQD